MINYFITLQSMYLPNFFAHYNLFFGGIYLEPPPFQKFLATPPARTHVLTKSFQIFNLLVDLLKLQKQACYSQINLNKHNQIVTTHRTIQHKIKMFRFVNNQIKVFTVIVTLQHQNNWFYNQNLQYVNKNMIKFLTVIQY
eukprot:TRINITY_DN30252_c0_g1_i14.p3 TRINITY_DN30252_c0_g1~~TRINITY_DN30252_c0_g1_i14.p3  ORF type:complete len:140 (-),score=0.41 TRINITY_DN30252_c0_g1_i14:1340-1759(-)